VARLSPLAEPARAIPRHALLHVRGENVLGDLRRARSGEGAVPASEWLSLAEVAPAPRQRRSECSYGPSSPSRAEEDLAGDRPERTEAAAWLKYRARRDPGAPPSWVHRVA